MGADEVKDQTFTDAGPIDDMVDDILPQPQMRPPFYDEVFDAGKELIAMLLATVPELEAVAFVPTWTTRQTSLPVAILMGRNGTTKTPAEVMHMAHALHEALRIQMERSIEILQNCDRVAGEMAREIYEREQRLEELEQAQPRDTAEEGERGSPGGAPAGDPDEGGDPELGLSAGG